MILYTKHNLEENRPLYIGPIPELKEGEPIPFHTSIRRNDETLTFEVHDSPGGFFRMHYHRRPVMSMEMTIEEAQMFAKALDTLLKMKP